MADEKYPRVKYHKTADARIVDGPTQEKALGQGWFDHPRDAQAGKVLTHVERGAMAGDPVPVPPGLTPEQVAAQEKAKADAEAKAKADADAKAAAQKA